RRHDKVVQRSILKQRNFSFDVVFRSGCHIDLHSFPTRRSSDLGGTCARPGRGQAWRRQGHGRTGRRAGWQGAAADQRAAAGAGRSEEHTSELQSRENLVCRLLLEKKKTNEKYSV